MKSLLARIHARRAVLRALIARAEQQYNQTERALGQLDRQLCVMHGALDELDALVKDDTAPSSSALEAIQEE